MRRHDEVRSPRRSGRMVRAAWSLAALAALAVAAAPASAQYSISWYTVDGGGATWSDGGVFRVGGTIGQPDANEMSGGVYTLKGGFWRGGFNMVGVDDGDPPLEAPRVFRLQPAYPNPVSARSVVAFDLPTARFVRLRIYDASGRVARTLAEGRLEAGRHQRVWNAVDERGRPVANGIYFVRFESETDRVTQKIAVVR